MRSKSEATQALMRKLRQLVAMEVNDTDLERVEAQNQFAAMECAIGDKASFKLLDDVGEQIDILTAKIRHARGNQTIPPLSRR